MFVLTFGKNGLRRLGAVAVCGVALAGAVVAVGSFFMEDDAAPAAANAAAAVGVGIRTTNGSSTTKTTSTISTMTTTSTDRR